MSKIYCGIGNVPRKSKRGSAAQCYNTKQVRYYGIKKIDIKKIQKKAIIERRKNQLIKEQLKLRKLNDKAKILLKNIKNTQLEVKVRKKKKLSTKVLDKKMAAYLTKRDKLIKLIKLQKKLVINLEK